MTALRDFHDAIMEGGGYLHWFADGILGIAFVLTLAGAVLFTGVAVIEPAVRAERVVAHE